MLEIVAAATQFSAASSEMTASSEMASSTQLLLTRKMVSPAWETVASATAVCLAIV
jgi:hypothetical protein